MNTARERGPYELNDLIVIVDDELNVLKTLSYALELDGFDVIRASDGLSGLAAVREHRPKFALLDIMLPGMTGDYVCREIRADADLPDLFIATMSAMPMADAGARLAGSGNDVHLVKPFDIEVLSQLVSDVFAGTVRSSCHTAVRSAEKPVSRSPRHTLVQLHERTRRTAPS